MWPADGPTVLWKRDVGQGFAGPVVAGGKLILFHRVQDKETVECLDARTGKTLWAADYPTGYVDDFGFDEGPRATPAVAEGKVYTFGADGALNCWDMATGRNVWGIDVKQALKSDKGYFGRACSPLIEGDAVILNVGGEGCGRGRRSTEKTERCFGKPPTTKPATPLPLPRRSRGSDTSWRSRGQGLKALDPGQGTVVFSFPWRSRIDASVNAASPLVCRRRNFSDGELRDRRRAAEAGKADAAAPAIPESPRALVVRRRALRAITPPPFIATGFSTAITAARSRGPDLRCVEWATGKVRWTSERFGAGSILLAGDKLLLLTERGELLLAGASPEGFKVLARSQVLPVRMPGLSRPCRGVHLARARISWCALIFAAKVRGNDREHVTGRNVIVTQFSTFDHCNTTTPTSENHDEIGATHVQLFLPALPSVALLSAVGAPLLPATASARGAVGETGRSGAAPRGTISPRTPACSRSGPKPARRWRGSPRDWAAGIPMCLSLEGKIFVMGEDSSTASLYALDAADGQKLWSVQIGPSGGTDYPGPRGTPDR